MLGGYIAASAALCDFIRSHASGFIFTTALPPAVAAGALTSVRHLSRSSVERERHRERVATLKQRLRAAGIPVMPNPSHIVPVMVCDAALCKQVSDVLLARAAAQVARSLDAILDRIEEEQAAEVPEATCPTCGKVAVGA